MRKIKWHKSCALDAVGKGKKVAKRWKPGERKTYKKFLNRKIRYENSEDLRID